MANSEDRHESRRKEALLLGQNALIAYELATNRESELAREITTNCFKCSGLFVMGLISPFSADNICFSWQKEPST